MVSASPPLLFSQDILNFIFYLNSKNFFPKLINGLKVINEQIDDPNLKMNLDSKLDGGGKLKTAKNVHYNLETFNSNVRLVHFLTIKHKRD